MSSGNDDHGLLLPEKKGAVMIFRSPVIRIGVLVSFIALLMPILLSAAGRDDDGYPRLMQGPMVGAVAPTQAKIWVRTSGEYEIAIEYARDFEMRSPTISGSVVAQKANDYTLVITLDGLEPATEYFYRVLVNGEGDKYLKEFPAFRFTTSPREGTPTTFRVAFGSCPKFQDDRVQPIWQVISGFEPDLFFWIGDNIYGDTLDPDILREEYRRQRDVHGLQPLLHNVSHLAVWDDHDFALNNHDRENPIKHEALDVFKDYWPNPAYGLPDTPGVFFTYSYGDVDFFFLDGRFYRDPNSDPDTPEKTMLGAAQFEWLKQELAASDGIFKVIVSGSGFSNAKGEGGDSWAAFLHERNRVFDFIRDREITGVILASGDSHFGEINVIPWSEKGGYDLYDLVSSALAQRTNDGWLHRRPERRIRPVYFKGSTVGVIDFILDETPRLMYRIIDIHGRNVWEPFVVRADELVNGVMSWPDKVHDDSRLRQEFYDAGKGYYEIEPED
jgi:alkaline phosphatase D